MKEYIAFTERMNETLWLNGMIGELGIMQNCVTIHCDSQSVIHLVDNQIFHERTKYIDIILHFMRDVVESREVRIGKIVSQENHVYMFTKFLLRSKFKPCLEHINFLFKDK